MRDFERLPMSASEAIPAIAHWLRGQSDRGAAVDLATAALARRQHGVVGRAQLLAIGLSPGAITHRMESGRLRPVLRGVYGAGPVGTRLERAQAAVLSLGPGTTLSHGTAAVLVRLFERAPADGIVEVSIDGSPRRSRGWLRVRVVSGLRADERTVVRGLPVTTPARTILDLADTLPSRAFERVFARALREKLVSTDELLLLCRRYPDRPASRMLIAILGEGGPVLVRSEAEAVFRRLLRKAGLPEPLVNVLVKGFEVDFFWKRERLVVEVDGFAFHSSREDFERDRERDGELTAAGYRVIRVTWRQITEEPEAVLVRVARALGVGR